MFFAKIMGLLMPQWQSTLFKSFDTSNAKAAGLLFFFS